MEQKLHYYSQRIRRKQCLTRILHEQGKVEIFLVYPSKSLTIIINTVIHRAPVSLNAPQVPYYSYHGFANFSLTMGSLGRFTSSSCSDESAEPGALPHLAPPVYITLLAGTGVGLGPCEPVPGPQRMWSGKWEHVECIYFDLSRLYSLQRLGFWCCLCLPLGNRFTIFPQFLIPQ